jgi:hypothetical protein
MKTTHAGITKCSVIDGKKEIKKEITIATSEASQFPTLL